ncbi:MAG: hypothetical protein VB074_03265 [Proteiniphilum sp.]|jgi:hypothetical protein|uniref:hypothetical protein n=1 Tax=Proteiniphilum sp. TaxID=1926877 RepID=UPI002B1F08DC|nr:hypothetical protein [Proteiniphilum sp.]MEA5127178.1 hypothetical protein [Proteiniphilum sp.]
MDSKKYDFSIIFEEVEKYKNENSDKLTNIDNYELQHVDLEEINKLSEICHEMREQENRQISYNIFT